MIKRFTNWADYVGLCTALVLATYQGILAVRYAVRIPMTDEWCNFAPQALERHLTWRYVLHFVSEHCIVLSRFLSWVVYRLADGHNTAAVCINYLIFLTTCGLFCALLRRLEAPGTLLLLPVLMLPMPHDVHAWGFQTHFYGSLGLFFGALLLASRPGRGQWAAGPLIVLAVFSFGAGTGMALVLLLLSTAFAAWEPGRRGAHLGNAAWAGGAIGLYLWLRTQQPHLQNHQFFMPWESGFWRYFCALLAKLFGWEDHMPLQAGGVAFCVLAGSLAMVLWRAARERSMPKLAFAGAMAGMLAAACGIAMGRSGFGINHATGGRYAAYTLFLPVMLWSAQAVLAHRRPLYLGALAAFLIVPLMPYANYRAPYRAFYEASVHYERCVWDYYAGKVDDCQEMMPWVQTGPLMDRAWDLNLAFVQEFKLMHHGKLTRYDAKPAPDA